ncbi:uncharacterized protein LOC132938922 [Metopolophium dirhodum]|uniref:uncharacterized protein LOC132938922 n=1 Tax=Metopolophium dirhodum TaxID=44670 RepID=UPI00298FA4A9|nr:uncharacterized protein LOC132938922 [Metopolophium dirhodum]
MNDVRVRAAQAMTTTPLPGPMPVNANECGDDDTAVDMTLFKVIGLHRMLDPGTTGRRLRAAYKCFAYLTVTVQLMQVAGLYASVNDLQRLASLAVVAFNALMCLFKGILMVTNADRMRAVLDVALYRYTTCGHRQPANMRLTSATASTLLRTFTVISYCTLVVWIISPLFTGVGCVQIEHNDGTSGVYRKTIDNMWLPGMSETVYNWPPVWATIYATEMVMMTVDMVIWIMFDCYLITVCFVLNAQFRTLAAGYETIGSQMLTLRRGVDFDKSMGGKSDDGAIDYLDYYEELIVHIKDNQNIIEKHDEFFEIVRPVVITQVVSSSISIVGLVFLIELLYFMGEPLTFGPVLRLIFGLISIIFQYYFYCYSFNSIETAKSTLNFGLYSSNWTEMDLKFKKTLFLAMSMNSAHMKVMRLSPKSIINLEIFAAVSIF